MLQRTQTLSSDILKITDGVRFRQKLQECTGWKGNRKPNGVYWEDPGNPETHFSFHAGGTVNEREGAVHFKYMPQYMTHKKHITFRIYITLTSPDQTFAKYGDYIYIDMSNVSEIEGQDRDLCVDKIKQLLNCLSQVLKPEMDKMINGNGSANGAATESVRETGPRMNRYGNQYNSVTGRSNGSRRNRYGNPYNSVTRRATGRANGRANGNRSRNRSRNRRGRE